MSKKIEFQFEELDYQKDAVNAVVNLLDGIPRGSANSIYSNLKAIRGFTSANPVANPRFSAGTRLIDNLKKVQFKNMLFKDNELASRIPNFTIEMETGTGKTFVYLKTILSLWQTYDYQFKKFIIVVPSNPILLGVEKSIKMLAPYFKPMFQNIDISEHYLVYDKNTRVENVSSSFIESTDLSILLLTCHSFNKETNRLRTASEREIVVWDDIKDVAPIVIIDEPQKLDGTAKKKSASLLAIEDLNPPMILRYSATHKNLYNQIYKLDSYEAYKKHLVKSIKVKTIHSLLPKDFPYVRYIGMTADLRARIEIFHLEQGEKIKFEKYDVDNTAALYELSGGLEQYKNWYIAEQPHKLYPLRISRNDGTILEIECGKSNDETNPEHTIEMQMRLAIQAQLDKQIEILENHSNIKALTLFFVDSVAKIRGDADDGRGEYLVTFDRVFEDIRQEPRYQMFYNMYPKELSILDLLVPVSSVREGYFAVDKHNKPVEIDKWNSEQSDEDVTLTAKAQEDVDRGIDLILNRKDELITFDEKLTFIFSHSALREGWDNPNVFTLVTLKHGGSETAKKQEVGRGLRLPVDIYGNRCKIDGINELTVIANDYYDNFASSLQNDYNQSMGFNKDEVSADIILNTLINAGVPAEKIEETCDILKRELITSGIVKADKSGEKLILTKDAENIDSVLFNDPVLQEHSIKIIEAFKDLMIDKGTKKIEIVNGDNPDDCNDLQKYVSEEAFNKMYRTMLNILQKRSIYCYEFDKDKFISDAATGINRLMKQKTDYAQFEIEESNVDFTEARRMQMTAPQKHIEESEICADEYAKKSTFEIANYLMFQTMLPRLAILKIIQKLEPECRQRINKQDYLDDALKYLQMLLIQYKSDKFKKAKIIPGISATEKDIFAIDKITNECDVKRIFTPNPIHKKAFNQKYVLDGKGGERSFAQSIDNDPNVLVYTKLKKGGFVIDTPAGNYSPDWAIVYQKNDAVAMYFIAETKWDKEWRDLMEDERIKINCAEKHFEAVNDEFSEHIKYAWVNSYKNKLTTNSFPEIFIDDSYINTLPIERTYK